MGTEQEQEQKDDKDCPPQKLGPDTPADGNPAAKPKCECLPAGPPAPVLDPPKPCPSKCNCPADPPATQSCFDKLIDGQAKLMNEAEQAKAFKAELEDLLKKANVAKAAYTQTKYKDYTNRWLEIDKKIVAAIGIVVCNKKCWDCVVECEICQLLYAIRDLELRLEGSGALIDKVYSLADLRYWHERNTAAKEAQFNRIKGVLNAWADPARTIEASLAANLKLVDSIRTLEPAEAILQLFAQLIPLHLAIAPRPVNTLIEKQYRDLCDCYPGEPDICCGPDVGILSALQTRIGPQAYIVDPEKYFDILCCLATERYLPAKNQLAAAKSALAGMDATIARSKADLERRRKSLFEDYRANVSNPLDCKDYAPKGSGTGDGGGTDCGCDPKTPETPAQTDTPTNPDTNTAS